MTTKIDEQKHLSIKLLGRLLHKNRESTALLSRTLPETLFQKVKAGRKEYKNNLDWSQMHWAEFFTDVVSRDYNNAVE